ncbi:Lhr family helicase [Enteractinococcus coprophilus]|uniref:Lhr family ATP dependent helicase n=1 Tax=Enteractinococcus coprophilus TaxID=1027633 RepID=A0A543AFW1_9MICC|nr:DEAD/DEAH box helicase [Enteractinococcus coprophilus]TQL71474.1 Lhr family ATP dependent helicase [Enteractinococcus coprophilus]
MTDAVLDEFSAATRSWFKASFAAPTRAQIGAWETINSGQHALVIAPTGSGKTLAAFLSAIDKLITADRDDDAGAKKRTRVLYISPLKALGVDVERNLTAPLVGITQTARGMGHEVPEVRTGVRSGDTSARDRRRLVTDPPDILITTPESLYLMLTSKARETLAGVETVIVDEVHALAGNKRGAHLAVSLERLDALLDKPAQRIGLSATVRPAEEVARFLGGVQPVTIVDGAEAKRWDITVAVPVVDMTQPDTGASPEENVSMWPHVEARIMELTDDYRSMIVFVNSRRSAERLTESLNELWEEREDTDGEEFARTHHGSMSATARAEVEEGLKSGTLRCVVATSSLELGIDMGVVDAVVHLQSAPTVAAGLQRVGRAGHQVGEVSVGWFFPLHRADVVDAAVVTERMLSGAIEAISIPANPLDILAQHTIAAAAMDDLVDEAWLELVRRAAPFTTLSLDVYASVLDLLAGKYVSDEFAQLKPRVVWDREAGTITARPGAQRLAVTSGGTIADRGLFGVYLATETDAAKRVGELDEEMVYESRVGETIILGATTWQIEEITHDRVLVTPAFGRPGRLPFWRGDQPGRPLELGRATGAFRREALADPKIDDRLQAAGLDENARANLLNYLTEQREATGHLPTDTTILVERFRDELGDWRVILHSPFGKAIHAPWALVISERVKATYGFDANAMAGDDGIIVRIPATDGEPPSTEIFWFDPEDLRDQLRQHVGSSALFAAHFRENAARALLLPRRDPTKRTPLWQQRQRAAQLLAVASKYPQFPIILETVREVLQDVYDVDGLLEVLENIRTRVLRVVEVQTPQASPFAQTLLFGYTAQFMYETDAPLAERRAAALSLDPGLLAQLLGQDMLRELLDDDVIAQVQADLQHTSVSRRLAGVEGAADLLRLLGPLTTDELAARLRDPDDADEPAEIATARAWVDQLVDDKRAIQVRIGAQQYWTAIEDAPRLRDGLGIPLPIGVPAAFAESVTDPLGDLVARYARTHGPFTAPEVAQRLGIGPVIAHQVLQRLASQQRVTFGAYLSTPPPGDGPVATDEWCDVEVLARIRRRSLAQLRAEVEPVEHAAYARYLLQAHQVTPTPQERGVDGLAIVLDQLTGFTAPAQVWETAILPARVADYRPAMLDELLATGQFVMAGDADQSVAFHHVETIDLTLPIRTTDDRTAVHDDIIEALTGTGGWFYAALNAQLADHSGADILAALWDLFWAGVVTNDTFTAVRATYTSTPRRAPAQRGSPRRTARLRRLNRLAPDTAIARQPDPPTAVGRWSLLPERTNDNTTALHAQAEYLLDRYGVITRGAVNAEALPGGFSAYYRLLSKMEESGHIRRGYFIDGLGAAQFSTAATVDALRAFDQDPTHPQAVALAATDPANPYGATLDWPDTEGHRPGRKAGAYVVLVNGKLALYLERGGKTLLQFSDDHLGPAATALEIALRRAGTDKLAIQTVNGDPLVGTELAGHLVEAGFYTAPNAVRFRA